MVTDCPSAVGSCHSSAAGGSLQELDSLLFRRSTLEQPGRVKPDGTRQHTCTFLLVPSFMSNGVVLVAKQAVGWKL
jgi:hypothetical protein